jgi:cobalt-zinc-cadmium efflux system protein
MDAHGHHSPTARSFQTAFQIGIALNLGFVLIETGAGIKAHSLALLADAGHNLVDVLGLILAWSATVLARRRTTPTRTYGWRRSSILAAWINALLISFALGAIAWEAAHRLFQPQPIVTGLMMGVAGAGILVNGITAFLFHRGSRHDLNIRGAFLHMTADAAISAGVLVAAVAITLTGWVQLDALLSLLICLIIGIGTWSLLRDSTNLALDAVPPHIDRKGIVAFLSQAPGVVDLHDLHIWAMSTTETALTAHLVVPESDPNDTLLANLESALHKQFQINHATLQIEHSLQHPACRLDLPHPSPPEHSHD